MAATPRPLSDEEIVAAVDQELMAARKLRDGRIGRERRIAYEYYFGEKFGNEEPGQSQVVSQLVMEVIDSVMPDIMKVFCGGENVVEFVARKAEDVPLAEQATAVANYVLYTQNQGFLRLFEGVKDALLQKTGAWKYWWQDDKKITQETYIGLTEGQLLLLHQDAEVEIVAANEYPDPNAQFLAPPSLGMEPSSPPAQAQAMGMPPGPSQSPTAPPQAPGDAAPVPTEPMLYDVTLKRTHNAGHICIESIPPDELLVSMRANTIDTQALPFIAHETHKTLSELVEMGYPQEVVLELPAGDDIAFLSEDAVARATHNDQVFPLGASGQESSDPMQRVVRYAEAWQLLDADGDGISELLKLCVAGKRILNKELADRVPLAVITPKIMPHEFYGVSLADDTCDLQLLKSTVWRQAMNALYQANFPRTIVIDKAGFSGPNTLADLLAPGPGKPIRVAGPGAVTPYTVDASAALQNSMGMMEFIEQEQEGRTPVSRHYQGLDPEAINKTATGVVTLTSRSQQRVELICRTFAETGIKELFRGILWLLAKYQQEPMIIRLQGTYVPIDPRAWKTEYDMTVSVGLGTGNRQEQLQMLSSIEGAQIAAAQNGMMGVLVSPKQLYNLQAKKAVLAGFKDPGAFWLKPPDNWQPPPPQPPPEVQIAQMRIAADQQMEGQRAQGKVVAEQAKADAQRQIETAQMQADFATGQHQAQLEGRLAVLRMDFETKLKAMERSFQQQTDIRIAEIRAIAQVEAARIAKGFGVGANMVDAMAGDLGIPQAADPLTRTAQAIEGFTQAIMQPKEIMRDASGKAIGIRPMNGAMQ